MAKKPSANYVMPTNKADINTLQVEGRSILLVPEDKLSTKDWYETDGKAAYTGSGTTGVAGTAAGVNPDAKYQDGRKHGASSAINCNMQNLANYMMNTSNTIVLHRVN